MTRRVGPVKIRCERCRMDQRLCLCAHVVALPVRLPVSVVFHRKEVPKPSNTGHFIAKVMPGTENLVYHSGDGYAHFCKRLEGLSPERRPLLVFPDPAAEVLSSVDLPAATERGLVFLDGTWHQAQSMAAKSTVLQGLPRRRLAPPQPVAQLWDEPITHGLATYEAFAWALAALYPAAVIADLWRLIRIRTHRIEWIRGLRCSGDVMGGISGFDGQGAKLAHC